MEKIGFDYNWYLCCFVLFFYVVQYKRFIFLSLCTRFSSLLTLCSLSIFVKCSSFSVWFLNFSSLFLFIVNTSKKPGRWLIHATNHFSMFGTLVYIFEVVPWPDTISSTTDLRLKKPVFGPLLSVALSSSQLAEVAYSLLQKQLNLSMVKNVQSSNVR